jgi:hypothetical protein
MNSTAELEAASMANLASSKKNAEDLKLESTLEDQELLSGNNEEPVFSDEQEEVQEEEHEHHSDDSIEY